MSKTNIILIFLMAATTMILADNPEEQQTESCNTTNYLALETASQKLLWTTEIMEILLALVSTMLLVSMLKIRKLKKKLKKFN